MIIHFKTVASNQSTINVPVYSHIKLARVKNTKRYKRKDIGSDKSQVAMFFKTNEPVCWIACTCTNEQK